MNVKKLVKSVFLFYIKGNMEEFEHKLRTFHQKDVRVIVEDFAVTYIVDSNGYKIEFIKDYTDEGEVWKVTSNRNDYRYIIKKGQKGNVRIVFEGPILALWQQNLLPRIEYLKNTLYGKLDQDEDFVQINEYMFKRLEKNDGVVSEQDGLRGHAINKVFGNEIKYLPVYKGYTGNKWTEKVPYDVVQSKRKRKRKRKHNNKK